MRSGVVGGPGHVEGAVRAVRQTDVIVWICQFLDLVQDSLPPEVNTELVGELGQQRVAQLEGGHDDLQILGAQHGRHLTGEKGRVEDLLQQTGLGVDHHPQHGLQGRLPHPGSRTGRVDLQQYGEEDPGEFSCQLLSLI